MVPTLPDGSHVLAEQLTPTSELRVGDLVFAHHPEDHGLLIVKRVARLDGDGRVSGIPDGRAMGRDARLVWLLSDQPDAGTDSRHFGPVSRSTVVARVTSRLA